MQISKIYSRAAPPSPAVHGRQKTHFPGTRTHRSNPTLHSSLSDWLGALFAIVSTAPPPTHTHTYTQLTKHGRLLPNNECTTRFAINQPRVAFYVIVYTALSHVSILSTHTRGSTIPQHAEGCLSCETQGFVITGLTSGINGNRANLVRLGSQTEVWNYTRNPKDRIAFQEKGRMRSLMRSLMRSFDEISHPRSHERSHAIFQSACDPLQTKGSTISRNKYMQHNLVRPAMRVLLVKPKH